MSHLANNRRQDAILICFGAVIFSRITTEQNAPGSPNQLINVEATRTWTVFLNYFQRKISACEEIERLL